MLEEELATYLRLTPEFGGTRFGPFEELEIRLGSDADRCHIVLLLRSFARHRRRVSSSSRADGWSHGVQLVLLLRVPRIVV